MARFSRGAVCFAAAVVIVVIAGSTSGGLALSLGTEAEEEGEDLEADVSDVAAANDDDNDPTPAAVAAAPVPAAVDIDPPKALKVVSVSQNSIRLRWNFTAPSGAALDGFRIFYAHQSYKDVKTIKTAHSHEDFARGSNRSSSSGGGGAGQQQQTAMTAMPVAVTHTYELTGLEPYTSYVIYVKATISGLESPDSSHIRANTDVDQPSAPILRNVTCYSTGKLYVEWRRPESFYNSVDYYMLYFRKKQAFFFDNVNIEASDATEIQRFFLEVEGPSDYIIKVCAGTKSLSPPFAALWGEASSEREVHLPAQDCLALPSSVYAAGDDDEEEAELSAGMIVGTVFAFIFLMMACVGFVVWRSYCKSAYYSLDDLPRVVAPPGFPDWEDIPGPDGVGSQSHCQTGGIPAVDLEDHVTKLHADTDHGFAKEYDEIQKFCNKEMANVPHEHCSHSDNKCKNRYLNIVAYDHSRVLLAPLPGHKKTSDYINGNYIDGFQKFNAYIGTQGPLEETCEAFWRMVWEQRVFVIVMITNLTERGRRKCDMYWPKDDNPVAYGFIEVSLEKENVMANYTVRTLRIKHLKLKKKKGTGGEREVLQYHYTSWPDHGVPTHPLPVLTFIKKSSESNPPDGGPIIVHCSAGVGRTGTYIAIDATIRQIRATGQFNVFGFLKHIRRQRNHLVQTEEQYIFIHDALLESSKSGITEIPSEEIGRSIEGLLAKNVDDPLHEDVTKLDLQYKLTTYFTPADFHFLSAKKAYNSSKNRDPSLLPIESSRVSLSPKPGIEGSDYINATWLHGHHKLREFVITQHPTDETKGEFWRMLWDHNAQTIVLLSSLNEETGFPVFWPILDAEFDQDTFRVRYIEKAIHEGHSTFDFVLSSCQDDYELTVRIIHCSDWPNTNAVVPVNLNRVFDVLKLVQDWHLEYGGTEAASFCALTTLCNQLETENSIDLYQVAKLYHNKRPGIWKSKDDLLFLYKSSECLVASSHPVNPRCRLHPTVPTSPVCLADASGLNLTSAPPAIPPTANGGVLVPLAQIAPERRHSSSDCRSNGSISGGGGAGEESGGDVFSAAATAAAPTATGEGSTCLMRSSSRRHSLPPSAAAVGSGGELLVENGCVIVMPKDDDDDEEEEEEERISETAALTTC